ncbi:MAG: PAS domain S-box protein [Acidobacteria bacterium]|nr:PAS domain S-box protein [Acidobacteriota bacterium]MBS1865297.1 PAS domain S-box protein [Acidobacteriota bacterium]
MFSTFNKSLNPLDIAFVKTASVAAIAVGCLDHVGWALRLPALTQVVSSFPTMKPLTGLCFILVGTAVTLLSGEESEVGRRSKLVAATCALAVLLICAATFLEYAGITGRTVDALLFHEAVAADPATYPGRISFATAISFSCLGLSVLSLIRHRGRMAWHQASAAVALVVGLLGILGYAYRSSSTNRFAPFDTMAVHTSVLSLLLGLALFLVRPSSGMMATFHSRLLGGFFARKTLPAALTLPFILGWMRLMGERAGYYGTEFGLAIFACANTVLFGILLWWTAHSLNSMDEQREEVAVFDRHRREILESIAKGIALKSILERIVLLVEAQAPGVRGSILLLNKESGRLTDGAAPNLPPEYTKAIDGIEIGPEVGSCGTAAYFAKRVVVEDIETHWLWRNFKDLALTHGLRACWSSPILTAAKEVLGTFAVYSQKPGAPSPMEFIWVDSATDLAAIAIERKNAEEALRRNEAQLRFLFESASVGIALVSSSGHMVKCNPAFCESVGYSVQELRSMRFNEITHAEDVAEESTEFEKMISGATNSFQLKKRYLHKSGKTVYANLNVSLIRTTSGAPLYGIHIVEDITQRHLAEQETERLQAQIQQAQRMQALGTLAGGIAHDFNNILASIVGNIEFAQDELPQVHATRPHLERIAESASRATDLVKQILAFSRLQAAQRKPVKLAPVIEEAVKLLRATLPAMIEIRVATGAKTPEILADSTQVHQIVMNLGTNAAYAMAEHGGILSFALEGSELKEGAVAGLKKGLYAHLTVTDNGVGMDTATLARVFEPFFTTKPQGQGTGLGLAVVHGIVSSYSGAILAKSSPGIGTSFDLYFPATSEALEAKTASDAIPRKGSGEHILLIDDEPAVGEVTRHQLARMGYRVTAFEDSSKALAAFVEDPGSFDAVLTDLSMPFISGLEVVSAIRINRPDIPIVLASGFFQASDQEAAKKLGVTEFLTKPFSSAVLGSTLARVFAPDAVDAHPVV